MKVFLDDLRDTPFGWTRTFTVPETIKLLETRKVSYLSLDNDLGEGLLEGWKVLDALEELVYNDKTFPIPVITIHSANSTRKEHMERTIKSIKRIRQEQIIKGLIQCQ